MTKGYITILNKAIIEQNIKTKRILFTIFLYKKIVSGIIESCENKINQNKLMDEKWMAVS